MSCQYNKEQLLKIKSNLQLISLKAFSILKVIDSEKDIIHTDIPSKAKTGKFVTDKCITAFIATGLIDKIDNGASKLYKLTEDGKNMLKLIGEDE